ncbi:Outer membrane protein assembly factor BamB [Vibrio stylophorae]|uniref:Outer membrane protein assembly factor BamB n=2 Tax=Vibrio stylophorae TaxID=659351 RepID=A0ABN8DQT1_9VIBR|nr:Outer membrane protein assembly factor BamB [Vibrio stylophorae]
MRHKLSKLIALTCLTSLLWGCSGSEDAIVVAPVPEFDNRLEPETVWQASTGDGVESFYSYLKPAVAYDRVYTADRDGTVSAFDEESGDRVWQVTVNHGDSALSAGPTVSYESVFVGSEDGLLFALNAEDGSEQWQQKVDGEVLAAPFVDEGLVVIQTTRGVVQAFDAETGAVRWQTSTDVPNLTLRGDSSFAGSSGAIFWGSANGRVNGAFMAHGGPIWQQTVGFAKGASEIERLVDVDATPIIAGDRIFALGYNGSLVALELRSGKVLWRRDYSSAKDFAVSGNGIYFVNADDHVIGVDARNGHELWRNDLLENRQLTPPLVQGSLVIVGDNEGYLYWLDNQTGQFLAKMKVDGSGLYSAPVELNQGLVIQTRSGRVKMIAVP